MSQFISIEEANAIIENIAKRLPIWEQRHQKASARSANQSSRRLTRPVYWLGAWQFACLGYYAEPDHREHRCLQAEPFFSPMPAILERLKPVLSEFHASSDLPNTCLMNYYGREVGRGVPRDYARLRMHRDGEPGPVIMFNIGQAGLLEFLDPNTPTKPELQVWNRHRSVTILSGSHYKDTLYHRVMQVRMGDKPQLSCDLEHFELRRVSISFRHVPESLIESLAQMPPQTSEKIRPYVEELAQRSPHFRQQLQQLQAASNEA